jgi:hypothetical protein
MRYAPIRSRQGSGYNGDYSPVGDAHSQIRAHGSHQRSDGGRESPPANTRRRESGMLAGSVAGILNSSRSQYPSQQPTRLA